VKLQLRVAIAAALAAAMAGCGSTESKGGQSGAAAAQESVSAPFQYHQEYTKIQHTNVSIKNFVARTEEGDLIPLASPALTVDLQALTAFGQGLVLDFTNVAFPQGADQANLAEVQATIDSSYKANIQSSEGLTCMLSDVPKSFSFFMDGGSFAVSHAKYHLKVSFSAIHAVQIDTLSACVPG
jgi:hypothetical protein